LRLNEKFHNRMAAFYYIRININLFYKPYLASQVEIGTNTKKTSNKEGVMLVKLLNSGTKEEQIKLAYPL